MGENLGQDHHSPVMDPVLYYSNGLIEAHLSMCLRLKLIKNLRGRLTIRINFDGEDKTPLRGGDFDEELK